MKYVNTDIVFQEIPNEVTLAVNVSNCPCRCPGCHSKYLWADIGEELNEAALDNFVEEYKTEITCISFMGGDAEPQEVNRLATYLHFRFPKLKVAWYTGRTLINRAIDKRQFDYIKVGPYIAHLGPLNNPKTNQRLYKIDRETQEESDITHLFWKKPL